jgi:hypothetical protein
MRVLWWLPLCLLPACTSAPEPSPAPPKEEETAVGKTDSTKATPSAAEMEKLAKSNPIAFLEESLRRYDQEVHGYRTTLVKQEFLDGKLQPIEKIDCLFREKPFSVRMDWQEGARKAKMTLYVKGENDGNLLVRPAGWRAIAGIRSRDPNGSEAKSSSRYPITEFGIKIGTEHVLAAWKAAKKRGDLEVVFGGEKRLPELQDRPCWEVKRIGYPEPEDDGITESTFYFDKENYLQIGSILKGPNGKLIAVYWFRDLKLNPTFSPTDFTRAALKSK